MVERLLEAVHSLAETRYPRAASLRLATLPPVAALRAANQKVDSGTMMTDCDNGF